MKRGHVAAPLLVMDDLVQLARIGGGSIVLAKVLVDLGWNVQRLGTLDGCEAEDLEDVVAGAEERLQESVDLNLLRDLAALAGKAAEVSWRVEGKSGDADLLVAHAQRELQDKMNEQRKKETTRLCELVPAKGTAEVKRWPTPHAEGECGEDGASKVDPGIEETPG